MHPRAGRLLVVDDEGADAILHKLLPLVHLEAVVDSLVPVES